MEEVLINIVFHARPFWDPSHEKIKHNAVLRKKLKEFAKETEKDGELIISLNNFIIKK
jgi:hypothetical protein